MAYDIKLPKKGQEFSQDNLERIVENIEASHTANRHNCQSYNFYRNFVYRTTIDGSQISAYAATNKPALEFPFLVPYLSRAVSEFSNQELTIVIEPKEGAQVSEELLEGLTGYARYLSREAKRDNIQVQTLAESMSGGFSGLEITMEYVQPYSFEKVLRITKEKDPTFTFYDVMSHTPTKRDARHCGRVYYLSESEFEKTFKGVNIRVAELSSFNGFEWEYYGQKERMVAVCDYYEKKPQKIKIVELSTGDVMTIEEYEKLKADWRKKRIIAQFPIIVPGKERTVEIDVICHYQLIQNQILAYRETSWTSFPLIFADGNSQYLRCENGPSYFMYTRSYFHDAKDAQLLRNLAGVSLADELQSQVAHKFMAAIEGLPAQPKYRQAYKNVQAASLLLYNQYANNDPNKPVNPPQAVPRVGAPPEIMQTFVESERMVQGILGSFDSGQGLYQANLSGKAISDGAIASNMAQQPYIDSFAITWTQAFNVVFEMLPKISKSSKRLPTIDKEGNPKYIDINQPGGLSLDYNPKTLNISVEIGVNSRIQQMRSMDLITQGMQTNEAFKDFMVAKGLDIYIDNIPVTGNKILKDRAIEYMKEFAQKQQQAQEMQAQAMQNDPRLLQAKNDAEKNQIALQKLEYDIKMQEVDLKLKEYQLSIEQMKEETARMKAAIEAKNAHVEAAVKLDSHETQKLHDQAEIVMKMAEIDHNHKKDVLQMHHDINMDHHNAKEDMQQRAHERKISEAEANRPRA